MWKYWELDLETTNTGAIGVKSIGEICLGWDDPITPDTLKAFVRWDGCTFVDDDRPVNRHICNLADEAARWVELYTLSRDYFGGAFGIGTLTDEAMAQYIREHQNVVDGSLAQPQLPSA